MTGDSTTHGYLPERLALRDLGTPNYEPTVKGPVAPVVACGNGSPRAAREDTPEPGERHVASENT